MTVTATPPRPEPVVIAAGVASGATSLVGLLVTVLAAAHVLTPAGASTLGPVLASAIPTLFGAVGTLIAAWHARARVTPLSDPRVPAAVEQVVDTVEHVVDGIRQITRPSGEQTPGVPDHAAPEPAST